jgi:predicted nucleotidyltransferase
MTSELGALDRNYRSLFGILLDHEVEFLLVGGYAVAFHGYARTTFDLDIWVRPEPGNAAKVYAALAAFGAPLKSSGVDPVDFATPNCVYQIGIKPLRIDVLTRIEGVEFEAAWKNRTFGAIDGRKIPIIGIRELIANKEAVGRDRDREDARRLRAGSDGVPPPKSARRGPRKR